MAASAASKLSWTLADLAQALGLTHTGDPDILISGMATLANAKPDQLSFLANPLYRAQLQGTKAAAVIMTAQEAQACSVPALVTENPYLLYAKASHLFDRRPPVAGGVHPTAVIAADASLGGGCKIGPNVVIGAGTQLGSGVEIGAGTVIGAGCTIGDDCLIHANVTLYHGVALGKRCTLHSGVVLGADGFGFANEHGAWVKIAQLGGVTVGDDVDIGANTTIDRGALQDTCIGNGVILDNQIQIAHNVEIGEGTAIAGCTGIAGSTKIGKYCTIAGAVGIAGHLTITDRVHITMRSAVTRNIEEPGSYSSGTAMSETRLWRKNAARFRKLDELARKVSNLEKKLTNKGKKDG